MSGSQIRNAGRTVRKANKRAPVYGLIDRLPSYMQNAASDLVPYARAVIAPWASGSHINKAKIPLSHTEDTVPLSIRTRIDGVIDWSLQDGPTPTVASGSTVTGSFMMVVTPWVVNCYRSHKDGIGIYTGSAATSVAPGWWNGLGTTDPPRYAAMLGDQIDDFTQLLSDMGSIRLVALGTKILPTSSPLNRSGNIHTCNTISLAQDGPMPNAPGSVLADLVANVGFPTPGMLPDPVNFRDVPSYAVHVADGPIVAHSFTPNQDGVEWWRMPAPGSGSQDCVIDSAASVPLLHIFFENVPMTVVNAEEQNPSGTVIGHTYFAKPQFDIIVTTHWECEPRPASVVKRMATPPAFSSAGFIEHVTNMIAGRPSSHKPSGASAWFKKFGTDIGKWGGQALANYLVKGVGDWLGGGASSAASGAGEAASIAEATEAAEAAGMILI